MTGKFAGLGVCRLAWARLRLIETGESFSGERSLTTYSVTRVFMVTVPQGTSVGPPRHEQLSRRRTSHGKLKTCW